MKISTKENTRPMTKTSSFLRFLVKICFITIKESDDNIKFSFTKLSFFLIGSFGWFLTSIILAQVSGITNSVEQNFAKVHYIFNKNCDFAIAMSSRADPVLGLEILSHYPDLGYLNI